MIMSEGNRFDRRGFLKGLLGLGLLKEKQKSELRVSRRCIEVERERDSFRSG